MEKEKKEKKKKLTDEEKEARKQRKERRKARQDIAARGGTVIVPRTGASGGASASPLIRTNSFTDKEKVLGGSSNEYAIVYLI